MKVFVDQTAQEMGAHAAKVAAQEIRSAIEARGVCRLLLSTGASQFEVLGALVEEKLPWDKVIMFHLDEYIGMPVTHPASFRKYLNERFVQKVHPMAAHYVNGEGDVDRNLAELTAILREAPIDVALIGIGENGHIAFNDPPADFDTQEAYIRVNLDERCRRQQLGEGWFATLEDVPRQAISMTVSQMMSSRVVLSIVPGLRKAEAVKKTLEAPETTPLVPATKLREHPAWTLFLDANSASAVDPGKLV